MNRTHIYYVYILTTFRNKVLYTGVTNDLIRRCSEHKNSKNQGFTSKYHVNKLVYFEIYDFIEIAIAREKKIKDMTRARKIKLINDLNPGWEELYQNNKIVKPSRDRLKAPDNNQVTI